jgi:hypothetical protein|tara:strand:- start:6053 stop:6346 length:294 start_codon:yes stop_codon:yes gene_type:complete
MPMPKGFKSENGYSTKKSLGGKSYQEISNIMSEKGYKMNHSTARNVFVSSLEKIARDVVGLYNLPTDDKSINRISKDPRFQDAIVNFMREIEYEGKK